MLQIGDQFDQYQIQSHLAQGGMSDIYRAFDVVNRREVAIKIPDQTMIGDPAQFERFQRELEVMNTLNHPVILRGLGSGKFNRIPYLVTEFVDGQSLRDMIEAHLNSEPAEAIRLVREIAGGLAYCHNHGVIHRDLKPENILITEDGKPVIMDFGLALTKSSHRVTYSNLSVTMGTPDYMSPEQIEGQRGDQRTDVYALGTILFEMLAGRTPFSGDTNLAIMAQHLHGTLPRLDQFASAVSAQLSAVVARSLAKDPNSRYQSMEAFIEALDHPDLADLAILEQPAITSTTSTDISRAQIFKAVGVALGVMAVLIFLAVVLQTLR